MANQLRVELGERSYPIYIQPGLLGSPAQLSEHIKTNKVVIVTNDTVDPLYSASIEQALAHLDWQKFVLPDGEGYKTLDSFEKISSFLLEVEASRDTTLLALGGGVIGDLTGFVAACFQRGIPFIQLPTTLLSQVDSSVGGKTAVNHPLGKNMIGAFYQPVAVFIDTQSLNTLPEREFAAGMAEVIKYGVIYDGEFFSWLEENVEKLRALDPEVIQYAIFRCCQIKAEIVAQDEKESGIRALLNLGHTFGHAIEAEMGYGNWLHGEAVAAGTILASEAAYHKGWLSASEVCRIKQLMEAFSLPVKAPEQMNYQSFMQHMKHDKKVKAGKIRFVLPESIGQAVVTDDLNQELLETLLN